MATRALCCVALLLTFVLLSVRCGPHHHDLEALGWVPGDGSSPECVGTVAECPGTGDECEMSSEISRRILATTSGDPVFLEPYWKLQAASSAVLVSGWHRMSYEATGDNYVSVELEKHVRLLHGAVGNAVTDDRFIVFGTGSTQLLNALLYAISSTDNSKSPLAPASVVASVPFYPMYQKQTDLLGSRGYQWKGYTSDTVNATTDGNIIDFVTSPNNPAPADEDVMLFSLSKFSGHGSSRFGWAVIKDRRAYEKATEYIVTNSEGVSRDTQLRVLKILKAILAQMRGKEGICEFGYGTMRERWQRLNNLISRSERFSLQQTSPEYCTYFQKIRDPSPAYGWLKCEMEEDGDCEAFLRGEGIITRGGTKFHADVRYARLSLIKTHSDTDAKDALLISKERLGYSI